MAAKETIMIKTELFVDITELTKLEMECACGTSLTLEYQKEEIQIPGSCPGCHAPLTGLEETLNKIAVLFRNLTGRNKAKFRFRLPAPVEK